MSLFSVNIKLEMVKALPSFLRGERFIALVNVLAYPIQWLKSVFEAERQELEEKTNYTNQRKATELYLNQVFNNGGSGIEILDGQNNQVYFYNKSEGSTEDPILYKIPEGKPWSYLWKKLEERLNFLVELPLSLYGSLRNNLRFISTIKFYTPLGRTFTIVKPGETTPGTGVAGGGYDPTKTLYA